MPQPTSLLPRAALRTADHTSAEPMPSDGESATARAPVGGPISGAAQLVDRLALSPKVLRGVGYGAAAAAIYGVATPLIGMTSNHVGPLATAAVMQAGALVLHSAGRPWMPSQGKPLAWRCTSNILLGGVSGGTAAPALLALALKKTSATSASMMLNSEVLFNFAVARLVFHEHTGLRTCVAAACALSSAVLVSAGQLHDNPASLSGLLLAAASALAWTVDNVASQALCEHKPRDTAAGFAAVGCVASTALALALREPFPDARHAAALMGIGVAAFGLVNPLYSLAQRDIGTARSGSIFAMSPFIGALAAWAMREGDVGPLMGAGAALLLLGVYLQATEQPRMPEVADAERAAPGSAHTSRPALRPIIDTLAPTVRVRPLARALLR